MNSFTCELDQWTYHHYNTATTTAQLGKLLLLLPKLPTIAAALAANSSRQRTPSFDRAGTSPRTHEKIQNNNKRTQLKKVNSKEYGFYDNFTLFGSGK